jgi:trigger factor
MVDEQLSDQPGTTASGDQPATAVTTPEDEAAKKKLRQVVEMKDIGPCKKHIKVTIDHENVAAKLNEKYSELVGDSAVPGFRPGKAPRRIIERRFRKEVSDQVRAEMLLQSLEQLSEEQDVAPLSAPNIDPTKIILPEDGPMVYEFEVEVRPAFDLPNYKGLKIKRPVRTFTEADVDREERRLLEPYGQVAPKTAPDGGEPVVEIGDTIIADVVTKFEGQVLSEIKESKVRVQPQLAFKDGLAPKLGEQLAGAKAGESRQVDITLSSAAATEALRGKTVQATFTIKDVKTVIMPEKTHEMMHEFGVHSAEQLRELLRLVLERRLDYEQRQAAREQVLAAITTTASWELPQDLLVRQARRAISRKMMEMRGSGMSEDEIASRIRLLQQDILQSTAQGLKEHFVLQKIAENEKIDINEDDINDEVDRIASQYNESPRRIRARLEKDDMMEALAAELIERKALDRILETATYEDVVQTEGAEGAAVATVEEQAVPGEMHDPTTQPAEAPAPPAQSE